jgi:hypothetical protein
VEETIMTNESISFNKTSPEYHTDGNKGIITGLLIALAIVLIAGTIIVSKSHKKRVMETSMLENQKLELAIQLGQRDSIINNWVLAFTEIESDIKKITARENILNLQSMNPEITNDKKTEILKEIQYVREMIEKNKKKIASLSSQLHSSGIKIASLQARIDTLNAHIAQRDKDIMALKMELVDRNFEIGQLNEKVGTMEMTMADQELKINQQTAEMNKAFIVSGTYKALKEKGLLNKEGGLLGLGRKKSLQENSINDNFFTLIDITQTKTIPVNSKSAKLITEHPANSYEWIKDEADKVAYIEIKDPVSFWKISRYAVVEVNN